MALEKLDTEVRQEQIVRAALDIVSSQGLRALSVGAVARRVGLVPSAIYRHFRSKDEVLDAAIAHIGGRLLGNVQSVCEETPEPLDRLRRLLLRQVQMIRENQVLAVPRILFSEDVYSGRPERKARVLQIIRRYLDKIGEIVQQAQAEGKIRADVNPDTVSAMFLGLMQQSAFLWHMSDGGFDVTRHAEKAWRIFSDALAPR